MKKKFISILTMVMMLVGCVMAVPAAVSADNANPLPTFFDTSGNEITDPKTYVDDIATVYLNGIEEVYIYESEKDGYMTMEYYDITKEGDYAEVDLPMFDGGPEITIYAGSKDKNVTGDMWIDIEGVYIDNLYTGGDGYTTGSVEVCMWDSWDYENEKETLFSVVDYMDFANTKEAYVYLYGGCVESVGNTEALKEMQAFYGMTEEDLAALGLSEDVLKMGIQLKMYMLTKDEEESLELDLSIAFWEEMLSGATFEEGLLATGSYTQEEVDFILSPDFGDGNKFVGWYLDKEYTKPLDLNKVITLEFPETIYKEKDGSYTLELYAKWEKEVTEQKPEPEEPTEPEEPADNNKDEQKGHKMGSGDIALMALILMTMAAAGITGGTLVMRRRG